MIKAKYILCMILLTSNLTAFAVKTENKSDMFFGWEKSQYTGNPSKNIYNNNRYTNFIIINNLENLDEIASKYKVSKYKIAKYNHMKPPYKLFPGQKLYLPSFKDYNYAVRKKDSLSLIANRHNIDVKFLARYNKINLSSKLKEGDIIKIPEQFILVAEEKNHQISENPVLVKKDDKITNKGKISIISSSKHFIWPVSGKVIIPFGFKPGGIKNDGINIAAKKGSPIKSASDGVVVYKGNKLKGYGNLVIIKHNNDWFTAYAHLDEIKVNLHENIKQGKIIATVGESGNVDMPQLHFALRKQTKALNPELYLP